MTCPQCQESDHSSVLACDLLREERLLDAMDVDEVLPADLLAAVSAMVGNAVRRRDGVR